VITVGAFDSKGAFLFSIGKGKLHERSSHGPIDPPPGGQPRTAPDLVAPGVRIEAPKNGEHESSCCECCLSAYKGDDDNTGTSIAAPHVAGVIALMLERHPRLSVADIRDILRRTADRPAEFTGPRTAAELNTFGFGRVNAVAALKLVPPFFGGPHPVVGISGRVTPRLPLTGGGAIPPPVLDAPCQALAGFAPFRDALALLRAHVLPTAEGQLCAVLVSRNFSEIRSLIRRNRRVAVAWHRAGGPLFLRTLMRALAARGRNADAPAVPDELPEDFPRFFAALARYGNAGLRSDLARHGDEFLSLMRYALDHLRRVKPAA
jgi:hypothetical protein